MDLCTVNKTLLSVVFWGHMFISLTPDVTVQWLAYTSESSLEVRSLPFRFSNQNFVWISHLPSHATCPAHLILLDL